MFITRVPVPISALITYRERTQVALDGFRLDRGHWNRLPAQIVTIHANQLLPQGTLAPQITEAQSLPGPELGSNSLSNSNRSFLQLVWKHFWFNFSHFEEFFNTKTVFLLRQLSK